MPALVWDQIGERTYEAGLTKGVLYTETGLGIPWNGLTSVEESSTSEVESVYFDGVKFSDIVTLGDFEAVMRAFTYPDEFLYYEGTIQDQTGFYVTNQPPSKFGLSYQTLIGDDLNPDAGYKIHIHYNLTAIPSNRTFDSISDQLDPIEFEWNITSIPEDIENFYPTAHVILDSRKLDAHMLQDIEDILYGSVDNDPHLPSLKGLSTFIRKWDRFIITDHGDGTWTAEAKTEGIITMLDSESFEIDIDTATYLDGNTYTITSTNKNEEDIWLP